MRARTTEAQILTDIMLAIFKINGRLLASGDKLSAPLGLTSARWQVLGAIAQANGARTVPQIADEMGMTRQGAQKQVNLLEADGLVTVSDNPRHKRSPLYRLTPIGQSTYNSINILHTGWANALAVGLDSAKLKTALDCLIALDERLGTVDPNEGHGL